MFIDVIVELFVNNDNRFWLFFDTALGLALYFLKGVAQKSITTMQIKGSSV